MNMKMYYQKDSVFCRFGQYSDAQGDYAVECEYDPQENHWAFFKCYDDDVVATSEEDITLETRISVQFAMLAKLKKQTSCSKDNIRLLSLHNGPQNVVYAVDNEWLKSTYPHFDTDIGLGYEHVIARAVLDKRVAFVYQPGASSPFVFIDTNVAEKGYATFANIMAQALRVTGHDDAASILDRMMNVWTQQKS